MKKWPLILLILCSSPLPLFAKRGSFGGGGGFNRGSSSARNQGSASLRGVSSSKTATKVNVPSGNANTFAKASAINTNRIGGSHGGQFSGSQGGFNSRNGGFSNGGGFQGGRPVGGINTNSGGFRNPAPSWNTGNRGFATGSGVGSVSRASNFKSALLGAAVGAAGGTKAIINHASSPFHWQNRPYYWGEQYYQGNSNQIMCSKPFEEVAQTTASTPAPAPAPVPAVDANSTDITTTTAAPAHVDQQFGNIQFQNGSRPKSIVWSCARGREVCCGLECCPAPPAPNMAAPKAESNGKFLALFAAAVIGFIILAGCACFCVLKFCSGSMFQNTNQQPHPYQCDKYDDQPHGAYPMQTYGGPQQGYSQPGYTAYGQQPGGYYAAQGYPSQYPPNPTY